MNVLIFGGGGQLAADLASALGGRATALSHLEADICDSDAVDRAYERVAPDVVFNCAAFHNVDECERAPEQAWRTNVQAVQDLARRGVPLVHFSTNYVFDGRREAPYAEGDLPAPRSVYALTKLAGEYAALAYGSRSLVVRTAGLYGLQGTASKGGNFVQRMVSRARDQGALRMVADQRLQPTFTRDLAAAVIEAVERKVCGLAHVTADGGCSWFEFTVAIMERAGLEVPVEPVATTIAPGSPDRPLNGVLARPEADSLGIARLRPWREALDDYMTRSGLADDDARVKGEA